MEHMELQRSSINISFNKPGYYLFRILGFSDHCGDDTYKSVEKCKFDIYYKFNVTNIEDNTFFKIFGDSYLWIGIIIVIIILILIMIYIFLCRKANSQFYAMTDQSKDSADTSRIQNNNNLELSYK